MPNNILIEMDLAGAEWVVVAYLSGDANMLDIIQNKKDPHTVTGMLISGAPEHIVMEESKLVGHNTDPNIINEVREGMPHLCDSEYFLPRSMSIRQAGKKSNHGLNYNMRYRRFALENEMAESEAKKIVALYRTSAYPGIPIWHNTVENKIRKDRYLINCFGRKRKFMDAWGPDLLDAAFSFLPQSTVADVVLEGMKKAYNDELEVFRFAKLRANVYDSLLYEYPTESLWAMSMFIDGMTSRYLNPTLTYSGREFSIDVDVKIGFDWGQESMKPLTLGKNIEETEQNIQALIGEALREREKA